VLQKGDTKLKAVTVNSEPIFKNFSLSDFPVNLQHPLCLAALPCETLMSENERQSLTNVVINDKLQGTVVTYLRCSGIINNQIKKRLLLSLPVKKSVNTWPSYGQKVDCVVHFFDFWQCGVHRTKYTRQPYLLASNFANYFHWQIQQ